MSIVAPIVATSAIVPVLAGVLLDGERPGALQWVGITAALGGVALASYEPGGKAVDSRKASNSRWSRRSASACHSSSSTPPPSTTR